MRQHDTFRLPRRSRGCDDQCVSSLDRDAVRKCVLVAIGTNNTSRAKSVEHRVARDEGKPGVQRSGSVARVPDGAQGIDETGSPGKVECDEFRHWPVA